MENNGIIPKTYNLIAFGPIPPKDKYGVRLLISEDSNIPLYVNYENVDYPVVGVISVPNLMFVAPQFIGFTRLYNSINDAANITWEKFLRGA